MQTSFPSSGVVVNEVDADVLTVVLRDEVIVEVGVVDGEVISQPANAPFAWYESMAALRVATESSQLTSSLRYPDGEHVKVEEP